MNYVWGWEYYATDNSLPYQTYKPVVAISTKFVSVDIPHLSFIFLHYKTQTFWGSLCSSQAPLYTTCYSALHYLHNLFTSVSSLMPFAQWFIWVWPAWLILSCPVTGSVDRMYDILSCAKISEGNLESSYLTLVSGSALMFGITNIVGEYRSSHEDRSSLDKCRLTIDQVWQSNVESLSSLSKYSFIFVKLGTVCMQSSTDWWRVGFKNRKVFAPAFITEECL